MAEANLRWKAQTSEAEAQILALKAVIDSIGSSSSQRNIRSTSGEIDRLGKDGERAGKDLEGAFKKGFRALDDFGKGLNGPFGILKPVGLLIQGFSQLEGGITSVGTSFESMGGSLGSLAPLLTTSVTGFVALGAALAILPAIIALVTFALTALADVFGILAAIIAGFTGPLLTIVGLLGGLAGAFFLGAKAALTSKTGFDGLQQRVKALGGEFAHFTRDLGHIFLPYFWQLAAAAQTTLDYFFKLSKMNLGQAFQSLNTQGVRLLDRFVRGLAGDIAKPFRLAIKIAFGRQSNLGNVIGGWVRSISNYLTGVHGALNPFVRWFNQQHFTSTGMRWAKEIIDAIVHSSAWAGFKSAVISIAKDAGAAAGHAFVDAFVSEVESLPGMIVGLINSSGPAIAGQGRSPYNPQNPQGNDPGASPGNPNPVRGRHP